MAEPLPKPARRGPKPPKPIRRRAIKRTSKPSRARSERAILLARWRKIQAGLMKLCDDTFAIIVRMRGKNVCRLCAVPGKQTQCAHLISRRYKGPRWSFENAWCLCSGCHTTWTYDPLGWDVLVARAVGVVEWERRKALAQIPCRPDYSSMRLPLKLLMLEERERHGLDKQVESLLERHAKVEATAEALAKEA